MSLALDSPHIIEDWLGRAPIKHRDLLIKNELTCASKSVASGKLPHTSKELGETTTEASHANDGISDVNATSLSIVKGKNESGWREREKAAGIFWGYQREEQKNDGLTECQDFQCATFHDRLWGPG